MSHSEKIQVVDEHTGELAGRVVTRAEMFAEKLWCRSTNVFIMNSKGELLCHQRSLAKERFPGVWSTHFGGHLAGEETYEENARKEAEEEIGIAIYPERLLPWRTSRKPSQRLWMRDYITLWDGDASTLTLQKSEIEQVAWFSPKEILEKFDASDDNELAVESEEWLAGSHNFNSDYQCMRAVITAAMSLGVFDEEYHHMHKWHPPHH
jgi:isopentenyldiphosphate isomerase